MVKGQKERDQYDLKQPFYRKSLTSDCTPSLGHLRISQCCWGRRSPVAQSDTPVLKFTSKKQLRTRLCVDLPNSNRFCRYVSRLLNTATPSFPTHLPFIICLAPLLSSLI